MVEKETVVVEETTTNETNQDTSNDIEAKKISSQVTEDEQDDNEVDDDDIEFDDSDTADDEEESSSKKEVTHKKTLNRRELSREKAKQRREQRDKELHSSYLKGIKTATGNINPYTNTEMETDEDVQDYLLMKEMEEQGLDPTDSRDYIKFTREKQKTIDAETKAKEQANNKYQTELLEFKTKYNDVDIENMVAKDASWASLIIPQIESGKTLIQAYENVTALINKSINEKANTLADEKAKKQVQNSLASVGSQTDGEENTKPKIDFAKMSDKDFNEFWSKKRTQ